MAHIETFSPSNDKAQVDKNVIRAYKIHLEALVEDPADKSDGDVWHRGDTNELRTQVNGEVRVIATEAVAESEE